MNYPKTASFVLAALALTAISTLLPQNAAAEEKCCLNNFRFSGGCMVVVRGSETCSSVLSYLNSFDSVGKYYCDNTTIRGGWTLGPCADATNNQPQYLAPQDKQPSRMPQQQQQTIRPSQKQIAPAASDASLMQVSAPLQVQFDADLDSTQGAGQMVTGVLQQDLMDGDTVIAPAGSTVQAQLVPTSYWADGAGDAFRIQATAIQVGDSVIPINGTAVAAQGEIATMGSQIKVPKGSMVSFDTAAAVASQAPQPTFSATGSAWMEAFNSHDAEALAALYTEDAVVLPPNEPAIFGRDAIRAAHQEMFAEGDFKIEIEALETVIDGHLAYVAGRYRTWTGGGDLVDRGKYIEIWRAVDGTWLIHRDIHNSSIQIEAAEKDAN